jgi:flagellar assembly factor FliW
MSGDLTMGERRSLGGLPLAQETIYHFPQGLPGFEELTRYVRCEPEELQPLTLLIALDTADIAFPLLRAGVFLRGYSPVIPADELQGLRVSSQSELELFVVVAFEDEGEGVTANLRAPICFTAAGGLGQQVVLPDESYPLLYRLVPPLD